MLRTTWLLIYTRHLFHLKWAEITYSQIHIMGWLRVCLYKRDRVLFHFLKVYPGSFTIYIQPFSRKFSRWNNLGGLKGWMVFHLLFTSITWTINVGTLCLSLSTHMHLIVMGVPVSISRLPAAKWVLVGDHQLCTNVLSIHGLPYWKKQAM